ncbi:MAG: 4-(cytidine 5'-diphospho)-2-C-methyl-D-erythritol kinase [Burkholderiaceae bacterium]|nr:4-(cytidine 5'-diphospho)-2-C-methyl-D-erythritol kinase [Burkholderiaceae bacterium]
MQALYDVPAPAKLNLFLHITGRKPDGYHLLQSVFMLIDWCDTLHFEIRGDGQISREDLGPPLPAVDLTLQAAQALQAATGCRQGAHIGVHKRIPAQAGMGGGSSDAASTLLALNRLWKLNLPRSTLETIGLSLGADIPFFLRGRNAWVEGIGEIILPLVNEQQPPPSQFVIVKPAAGLDTKSIFSSEDLRRDSNHATIADFAAEHYQFGKNNLQSVAEALCPEISQALHWLEKNGLQGRMTGSGSAVFAQIKQTFDVHSAPSKWTIKVCKNLEIHPLEGWSTN